MLKLLWPIREQAGPVWFVIHASKKSLIKIRQKPVEPEFFRKAIRRTRLLRFYNLIKHGRHSVIQIGDAKEVDSKNKV